jgi:transcriptional regulator with XRE-family HTH domain
MQEQLREILSRENLTSSQFADRIGVQRSSVSHVISGRNKPGFDFISKILTAFPGLNANWLISGSGQMYGGEAHETSTSPPPVLEEETDQAPASQTDVKEKEPIPDATAEPLPPKEVERIVVFYKDRTFREYSTES